MNLTIDQFDTIHMSLRRATAISRLIAECSAGREQVEIPGDTLCAATHLVAELLGTAQGMLWEARDSVDEATDQDEETPQ